MNEPRRFVFTIKPESFEILNNGYYHYNYDIKEVEKEVPNPNDMTKAIKQKQYSFVQVELKGRPDYNQLVQAIIRQYITYNEEFDTINSYNKVMLGLSTNTQDVANYKEYLKLLDTIKTNIKKDIADFEAK